MRKGLLFALIFLVTGFMYTVNAKGEEDMISEGKKVKFDYTLTVDGQVVDTSEGRQPLEYTQGEGKIITGLEQQMTGLKEGEEKKIEVAAEKGYGERNPDALREVPKEQFPPNITPEQGQQLAMTTPDGQRVPVLVSEVKDESVILDFNHPLAGKDLSFDVKVVSVEE